jgi:TRAP-type uncharacterized transport system substrate-binding protein
MATLVTRADIEADIVQSLVRHVLDGRAGLAQRAPVLNDLAPGRMWRQGLTAPLHAGAKAAFAGASVVGTPPSKVLENERR